MDQPPQGHDRRATAEELAELFRNMVVALGAEGVEREPALTPAQARLSLMYAGIRGFTGYVSRDPVAYVLPSRLFPIQEEWWFEVVVPGGTPYLQTAVFYHRLPNRRDDVELARRRLHVVDVDPWWRDRMTLDDDDKVLRAGPVPRPNEATRDHTWVELLDPSGIPVRLAVPVVLDQVEVGLGSANLEEEGS